MKRMIFIVALRQVFLHARAAGLAQLKVLPKLGNLRVDGTRVNYFEDS